MKFMLIAVLALVACDGSKTEKQYPGQVPPAEGSHIVQRRIPPDTLVDESGRFCVVRPSGKWEAADSGVSYENCAWSDTARTK